MTAPLDDAPDLVLVVNAGSSSVKYQLLDTTSAYTLAVGLIERIGETEARASARHTGPAGTTEWAVDCPDHRRAFEAGFDAHLVKPAEPDELRRLLEQVAAPA